MLNNQVIIVLGMHRSGTSVLTRLLNLHGMAVGSNLLPTAADNETGFWEHQEIVSLHDEILGLLGTSWHQEKFPEQWWRLEALRHYRQKMAEILVRDFSQYQLWGIKDPRMCRLLAFWLPILAELNCRPLFVLAVRHPFEVVKSLEKRNGFTFRKTERLWLQHALMAEAATREWPRTIVLYEQLLADWKNVMRRIRRMQPGEWLKSSEGDEADQLLNPALRHHQAPQGAVESVSWPRKVYESFVKNGLRKTPADILKKQSAPPPPQTSAGDPELTAWTNQAYEAFAKGAAGREALMIRNLKPIGLAYDTALELFG
jgi:hypothetical protein